MDINKKQEGDTKYIVQISTGNMITRVNWYHYHDDYELAYKEFLDQIQVYKELAFYGDDEMGIYIHVGPGTLIMFMSEKMAEKAALQQKLMQGQ